ncbi:uncharacterized protein LOC109536673 [Dendroctonus ponderosae]|uniref:CHK kinase-like domain-containing protein n=1 Tax=Dendroctonus ponderosae TaxID=77166 RepID=U4U5Y9_DENPD|nr:uncharacterized protein LOC109536673 [Dendroctonus ponderosae]ERL88482.1 hypothetical protein D910_05868 [Dendroctonus ponderosae]
MTSQIVTREDCQIVVKNHLKRELFQITDYQTGQFFDEVNGFLGEHLFLTINVLLEGKIQTLRFFLKKFPSTHPLQSEFLRSMNGWQREIYCFQTFLPTIKQTLPDYQLDFVPECFLGKPDDVLVFEDLTLRNYDLPRQANLNLLDNEHICLALASLAKFHAGSLAYEEYQSKRLGEPFRLFTGQEQLVKEPLLRRENGFLGYDFFKAAMKGLKALIGKVHPKNQVALEEVQQKFDTLAAKALALMCPQTTFRNVLAHGDLWAKNVMFQYEGHKPIKAVLVDFQLIRYHVPAHDVLMFLALTTNRQVRQEKFHFYLKFYHDALAKELERVNIDATSIGMSYEQFQKSVSFIMPEIKIHGALLRLQQCGNKDFYKKLVTDKEAYKNFIFVDKAPFALELFETDANFRTLLSEAVEEIIEAAL